MINTNHTPYRYDYPIEGYSGKIYNFLRGRYHYSGRVLRCVKYEGKVLLNGEDTFFSRRCEDGDTLTVIFPEESPDLLAGDVPFGVIYEDTDILIADKPPYILVHPTGSHQEGTLANGVYAHWKNTGYKGKLHFVSRLDMNTSGLITIGKNRYIHGALQAMGEKGMIQKTYLAICRGNPPEKEGRIEASIGRVEGSIYRSCDEDGKESITEYRLVECFKDYCLVELRLLTGRTHQIRVHMKSIGCPVLGDDLYDVPSELISRQALHSARLSLIHPYSGETLEFSSSLPEDMQHCLEILRQKN